MGKKLASKCKGPEKSIRRVSAHHGKAGGGGGWNCIYCFRQGILRIKKKRKKYKKAPEEKKGGGYLFVLRFCREKDHLYLTRKKA